MKDELPEWAQAMVPLTHGQAAYVLGVSERKLWTIVKLHPHFERRGRANAYYPEHIEKLRSAVGQPRPRAVPEVEEVEIGEPQSERVAALMAEARKRMEKRRGGRT